MTRGKYLHIYARKNMYEDYYPSVLYYVLDFMFQTVLKFVLLLFPVEEDVLVENRSAIYRQMNRRSADRSKRSVGQHRQHSAVSRRTHIFFTNHTENRSINLLKSSLFCQIAQTSLQISVIININSIRKRLYLSHHKSALR